MSVGEEVETSALSSESLGNVLRGARSIDQFGFLRYADAHRMKISQRRIGACAIDSS